MLLSVFIIIILGKLSTHPTFNGIFPYIAGQSESIECSWDGNNVHTLEWFLEDVATLPIASETNTSTLTLFPDTSTSGLNGTRFMCRATTSKGDHFEEIVTLCIKGSKYLPIYNVSLDSEKSLLSVIDVVIDVQVIYEQPPRFNLQSPPYYRSASSVTFRCDISGSRQIGHYEWKFNHLYSLRVNTAQFYIDRLTVANNGVYTCFATDESGIVYTASQSLSIAGKTLSTMSSSYEIDSIYFLPLIHHKSLLKCFIPRWWSIRSTK